MKGSTILALIAVLLSAGAAHATDAKRYPGSMCVRWAGGSGPTPWFGIGRSASLAATYVDCPIVRDHVFTVEASPERGGIIEVAEVEVIDTNADDDVRCRLATSFRGSAGFVSAPATTSGDSPSSRTLTIDGPDRVLAEGEHAYLSCKIPGTTTWPERPSINSYVIEEGT